MRVLVTGGAGFIGSNYVYSHLEARPDDELTVLDALTYSGHREHLTMAETQGVKFVEGRIEDRALVKALFENQHFDIVVHFAAETHVDRSILDPEIFVRTNVQGTQVLLDAARDYGVQRFHHISTDEVYGDLGFGSSGQFKEDRVLAPSNPYSATKAASDLLCLSYLRTFGVPVTVSRCSNNFGPYQSKENLIPLLILKAMNDEPLPLYGNGKNVRDWLYVKDHCEAILAILERGTVGEIYNIGADNDQENLTIAKMVLRLLGKPENLIHFVKDRPGHDERYSMDFAKMNATLGWSPSTPFEEGLRKTIDWYKLVAYERSHSRGGHGLQARSAHQSHQQTPSTHL